MTMKSDFESRDAEGGIPPPGVRDNQTTDAANRVSIQRHNVLIEGVAAAATAQAGTPTILTLSLSALILADARTWLDERPDFAVILGETAFEVHSTQVMQAMCEVRDEQWLLERLLKKVDLGSSSQQRGIYEHLSGGDAIQRYPRWSDYQSLVAHRHRAAHGGVKPGRAEAEQFLGVVAALMGDMSATLEKVREAQA